MRRTIARSLLTGCLVLLANPARSADPNAIALRVGSRNISVGELERRWLALPAFQRRALGSSTLSGVRAFIDRWVIPDLLLSQAIEPARAHKSPQELAAERAALRQALVNQVRRETERTAPVTQEDIRAYFDAHRELFDRPERLRLFRILLADRKSAEDLIQKARSTTDFDTWRKLAREMSLDQATRMRAGELGFVSADGKSDFVELQVDPKLFEAAAGLRDGELAKEPIAEGDKFAVLWRRGHTAAQRAGLDVHQAAIREHLAQARAQVAVATLVDELRRRYVRDLHPEGLEGVTFEPAAGDNFDAGTTRTAPRPARSSVVPDKR